jgi:protein SCO1/2
MNAPPQQTKTGGMGLVWVLLAVISAVTLGVWLGMVVFAPPVTRPPQDIHATYLPEPRGLAAFELLDQNGQRFTQADMPGNWTFVFFGYTHCPDVCPATLSVLNGVTKRLSADQDAPHKVRVLFVSVDPERDTPEQLSKFVPYFNPDFIGLTGTPEAITALTRSLGVLHVRVNNEGNPGGYLVDHSASVLLFDPEGRLYALFSPPLEAGQMADDFLKLAQYYEGDR